VGNDNGAGPYWSCGWDYFDQTQGQREITAKPDGTRARRAVFQDKLTINLLYLIKTYE
jgi:hypothetical protein